MFEPAEGDSLWVTSVPFIYNIDYASNHVGNDSYIGMVAEAPPTLLHVGHDVPFKSMYGPVDEFDFMSRGLLKPEEVWERIESLKSYVSRLHQAGAKLVIPYICSMFMFGDAKRREGFWRFYDSWEKYSEFGFGSKPKTDPITWSYQRRRPIGFDHVENLDGRYVYEPCINHPDWRRFLRTVVAHIAKVGYDGVFVDVNASACPKARCRSLFRKYLEARYTKDELSKLFGFDSSQQVRLGRRGEGLLWVETVRFRGERMSDLFHDLRNEGLKYRDTFIVLPNLSPYQHVHGVWKRVGISHVITSWARECPVIMFEEMQQPGLLGEGVISNFIFQYKYAFANAARAGCLLYNSQDRDGVEISIAEAASGGGGAFIQGGYSCPKVRRDYRNFFTRRGSLFDGMLPYSSVGLLFFYDQLAWGTKSHMETTYRIAEELMARHVLFDLVVERSFNLNSLQRYKAIIICDLENMSDYNAKCIGEYLKGGGVLISIGNVGKSDDKGNRRNGCIFDVIPHGDWDPIAKGVRRASIGKGVCLRVDRLQRLLSPLPFELFMISEDDSLEIKKIFELIEESKGRSLDRTRSLVQEIERITGMISISECDETTRFNAYRREEEGMWTLTLHAVNYNLPVLGRGKSGPPIPASPRINLEIPSSWEIERAEIYSPPNVKPEELSFSQKGGHLVFNFPEFDIYSVARVASISNI